MDGYNVDLLMQVREKIVNEPEKHNQQVWASADSDPAEGGDCGTAYCVAGWAAVLDGQQLHWGYDEIEDFYEAFTTEGGAHISTYARDALGLQPVEADRLFSGTNGRMYILDMLDRLIEAGKNGERLERCDPAWRGL